jgi:hypothetical protein
LAHTDDLPVVIYVEGFAYRPSKRTYVDHHRLLRIRARGTAKRDSEEDRYREHCASRRWSARAASDESLGMLHVSLGQLRR